MDPLMFDLLLGFGLAVLIICVIAATDRLYAKGITNPWVNRKLIHIASVPAALAYAYWFHTPYVFWAMALFFVLMTAIPHVRGKEMPSFQMKENYGEVYYCFTWLFMSMIMWEHRVIAGAIMLFMALGDAATGLARFYLTKINRRHKHWYGSVAMFVVCLVIALLMLTRDIVVAAIVSAVVTLVEKQDVIDDNVAVPLTGLAVLKLLGLW